MGGVLKETRLPGLEMGSLDAERRAGTLSLTMCCFIIVSAFRFDSMASLMTLHLHFFLLRFSRAKLSTASGHPENSF